MENGMGVDKSTAIRTPSFDVKFIIKNAVSHIFIHS